jgi:hypothetical protein
MTYPNALFLIDQEFMDQESFPDWKDRQRLLFKAREDLQRQIVTLGLIHLQVPSTSKQLPIFIKDLSQQRWWGWLRTAEVNSIDQQEPIWIYGYFQDQSIERR